MLLPGASVEGLTRALAIAVAAVPLGYGCAAALVSRRRAVRLLAWALAVACFFTPPLLVGYAYANFTTLMRYSDALRGGVYAALVLSRLVPLAALLWLICPGRVAPEAWHCLRLLWPQLSGPARLGHVWGLLRHGALTTAVALFGAIFLLAFTEFELASFLGVEQWTVAIFDAQVGGMALTESLRRVALPALMAAALAIVVVRALGSRTQPQGAAAMTTWRQPAKPWVVVGLVGLIAGALLVAVVPGGIVLFDTLPDALPAARQFGLQRELASSLLIAVSAGLLACMVARIVLVRVRTRTQRALRQVAVIALLLPGLLGGLVLGLVLMAAIQLPLLRWLRPTPLPLVVAAALLIMPVALLIQMLLQRRRVAPDLHVAHLLEASPLRRLRRRALSIDWVRSRRPLFWAAALLIYQLFSDVTLASLLAPVRMPLVMPRLYNFMHYGRSEVLTASLLITLLVPLAALALAGLTYRSWRSWHAASLDA